MRSALVGFVSSCMWLQWAFQVSATMTTTTKKTTTTTTAIHAMCIQDAAQERIVNVEMGEIIKVVCDLGRANLRKQTRKKTFANH